MSHLHDMDETYVEHLCVALSIAGRTIWVSILCVIHALVPFLAVNIPSDILKRVVTECEMRKAAAEVRLEEKEDA